MNKGIKLKMFLDALVQVLKPEKIFLLGTAGFAYETSSVFVKTSPEWYEDDHYNMLILIPTDDQQNAKLETEIETGCRHIVPGVITIMSMRQFNHWLATCHPFAMRIMEADCLSYDAGKTPFAEADSIDGMDWPDKLMKEFTDRHAEAGAFLTMADIQLKKRDYRKAAFSLVQAVNKLFQVMIQATTGYCPENADPDRLHRFSLSFCEGLGEIFPRNKDGIVEEFRFLQQAADAKAKNPSRLKPSDFNPLMPKIRALEKMAAMMISVRQHSIMED